MENTEQKINEYYYDAMDCLVARDTKTAMDLLQKAIVLDNRAYLRIIAHKADYLCDIGEKEEGIELYKLLLNSGTAKEG